MRTIRIATLFFSAFLGALVAVAAADSKKDDMPGMDMGGMMPGMMERGQQMVMPEMMEQGREMMMGEMTRRLPPSPPPMMRRHMSELNFYLDRSVELGLTEEQVGKLREIRSAFLRDNIRNRADLKIARLDLEEVLDGDWTLSEAEGVVRRMEKLEGDLKVRCLKALADARGVLTAEQLKKFESTRGEIPMDELF